VALSTSDIQETGEHWLLNAPATAAQLSQAERELGIAWPPDLREFLLVTNGTRLPHPMMDDPAEAAMHGLEIFFGIDRQLLETKHFRLHWLADSEPHVPEFANDLDKFLIVAEDGHGNYLACSSVGRTDGQWGLGFLDHETREFEAWEDFGVLDLLADLHW